MIWSKITWKIPFLLGAAIALSTWSHVAVAEEVVAEVAAETAAEEGPLSFQQEMTYTINTLIMFVCAVLVLFMQAGFAMLEVGLNAAKNTVNILFKNLMDLSVGVL
jgi:Amt family ammonium transporter